jgi:hypothetical protein
MRQTFYVVRVEPLDPSVPGYWGRTFARAANAWREAKRLANLHAVGAKTVAAVTVVKVA